MSVLVTLFTIKTITARDLFTCDESPCPSSYIGDGWCDPFCMNSGCNYDSLDKSSSTSSGRFLSSDCFYECMKYNCDYYSLGNGICETECNNYECGWDLEDCGYCSSDCTTILLGNNICNYECNNNLCQYDNNDCGWCAEGCFIDNMSDTICQEECNNYECNYDNYFCLNVCPDSCPIQWIGDSYCDYICNIASCNYDDGDCDCDTGCTSNIFNEETCRYTNGVIDDPCATAKCNFKHNVCGWCDVGCFLENLGNGKCNETCNVENCYYDYGDCGCNSGCSTRLLDGQFDYKGACEKECLVPECGYNLGVCTDKIAIQAAVLYQIIKKSWSEEYNSTLCSDGCSDSIAQTYTDLNKCPIENDCNKDECLNCYGNVENTILNCVKSDGIDCLVCDTMMILDQCISQVGECPLGYVEMNITKYFLPLVKWCFVDPEKYSVNKYKIFYVSPSESEDYGDGSQEFPMVSLYYALISVYASHTKIYLDYTKDHYFKVSPENATSPFISDSKDPLNTISWYSFEELWIESDNENFRAKVYWTSGMKITPAAKYFYIKNIDFYGTKILNDCQDEVCLYCPYVQGSGSIWLDDRNEYIPLEDYMEKYGKDCSDYSSVLIFDFSNSATFENVLFNGFRYQYSSFILTTGDLTFTNVNFVKMQAAASGSVIKILCTSDCENTSFYYYQGLVQDIGAGYEDTEFVTTGSFFYGSGYHSAIFSEVQFSYNFAFSNLQSSNSGSLIYSYNQIGTITISECSFEYNYVNNLIYIDVSSLFYSDHKVEQGVSIAYNQTHFQLKSSNFTHNYGSNHFIYYYMTKITHNIIIENVMIEDAIVGDSGIVVIYNIGSLKTSDTIGQSVKILSGTEILNIEIPSRSVIINKLSIISGRCGGVVLQITAMPNIFISNVEILDIKDGQKEDIKVIIDAYSKSGRYLSKDPPDEEVPALSCTRITSLTSLYYLYMQYIEISNSNCKTNQGTAGLYIDTISTNVTIDNLYIHNIEDFSSEPIAFYVKDIEKSYLSNIFLANIINQDYAVLEFYQVFEVKLENFTGNYLEAVYSGVNLFTLVEILTITNATFNKSYSHYGDGGCFAIKASYQGLIITVTDIHLEYCEVFTGNGAGIYLDSISTASKVLLNMLNTYAFGCYAVDGAILYISSKVAFDNDKRSSITNLEADSNFAYQGGIISDYHKDGFLLLNYMYFIHNEGLSSGIYGFYSVIYELLAIKNSIFKNSTSYEGVFSLKCFIEGSLVTFENITINYISATIFEANKIDIKVINSSLSYINSAVTADNSAKFYFLNCNLSNIDNYAVSVSKTSYFDCNYCLIQYCKDIVLTVGESSSFNITNSEFSYNTAYSTVILYLTGEENGNKNNIINSIFAYNSATTDNLMYLSNTDIEINGCVFKDNLCVNTDSNGIYSSTSNLVIKNSEFYNQKALAAGGFMYLLTSTTSIWYSKFSGGISDKHGGAIYVSSGSLSISKCEFWLNQATEAGGSIYLDSTEVTIDDSMFYQCKASTGDAIYAEDSIVSITKSLFFNSMTFSNLPSASIITKNKCKLTISDSLFKDSWGSVGGILLYDSKNTLIENSKFYKLNIINYGAATFIGGTEEYNITIKNSTFTHNNSTGNGTGIHIENVGLEMIDSDISYNSAQVNGGGLYLVTPSCISCEFYIRGSSKIVSNSCLKEGGGIKWLDFKPIIEDTVIIENNTAEYGANFASKASSLNFKKRRLTEISVIGMLSEIAPGQTYSEFIELYLYDLDGNIVKTDNSSQAVLTCLNSDDFHFVSGNTTFTANKGKFSIGDFIPNGPPGQNISLIITTSGITESESDPNITNSAIINIFFRECINGEAIGSSSCDPCPTGKYLLKPEDSCKQCPTGGICTGKDVIISAAGYWRSDLLSEILYACEISEACSGGDENNFLGNCSDGYTGVLCQSCENGYSKNTASKCSKCPDQVMNMVILVSFLVLIVLIAIILVHTTLKTAFSNSDLHSIYIKIFTNYLQLVFLTAQFNFAWPKYVIKLLDIQKSAASVSEQLFSIDCYVDTQDSSSSTNTYYYKIVFFGFLPLIIFIISFAVWLAISFIKNSYRYLRREYFTTLVVLFFIVYPNVVKAMLLNYSCVYVDMKGNFLDENTKIECWKGDHLKYSLIITIPAIIIWALGIPALVLIRITKQRRFLHRDYNKIIFGFIYNGYKTTHFYWEFIIMYRKVIMIAIFVFMGSESTLVQALTIVLVLLGFLFIQHSKRPYCYSELNYMESEALFTATLTIYCGLYYLSNAISERLKMLLFIIIVFGNSYFILYWIYYMIQALINIFIKYSPRMRYILKKGDAFDENFNAEDIIHEGTYINEMEEAKNYTFMKKKNETKYVSVPHDLKGLMASVLKHELGVYSNDSGSGMWISGELDRI